MNQLVKRISSFIIRYDTSLKISKEILEYSIVLFLESFLVLLSFICVSLLFNQLGSGIVLIITLILMRNFFGGGHASSFKICFCISNLAFILGIFFIPFARECSIFVLALVLILSVFFFTIKSDNIVKNLLFSTVATFSVLMVIVHIPFGYYLIASCLLTSLADLLFKKVGEKNEKENAVRETP